MSSSPDVSHIDVRYVADLARIELTEDECRRYQKELDAVLDYVDQLRELDVEGIEPTAHAVRRVNIMRQDVPGPCLERDDVLANAPETADDAFVRVGLVIDEESA